MLDKETKNKIDDLRQILVGKVTDPRSQVEQITNALLYKFMNDMDEESVSMGGVPSYFIKEYEKYSWKILLDTKTSGEERVNLYSTGIEKMYFNENLPGVFREIFKDSTLPYKDAKVFNKFITRVNDFKYSNSESLGDAFEYLLSFMGKQGEAGQFRTPRHIINFIVEIVNPKKNESVLDPASGTAGFLISAYKHILNQNKKKIPGDLLNVSDRKKISENLNGYDISPEFLKVSLMNMFLHKFNNPRIFEYDTLSSENKWNEYYDVMLANPPFFTPKGGITPHNRFSIKSNRAEVLFIDYIIEHLKPNGRAGIIVPEGVIFRDGGGFKDIRLKILKNSLFGIISLPAGVFEPYSNVKTSILIIDKSLSKKNDYIFFAKINNDGFTLSKNRVAIEDNDIPNILKLLKSNNFSEEKSLRKIKKKNILDGDIRSHIKDLVEIESKYRLLKLSDIAFVSAGNSAPQDKNFYKDGNYPFIRTSDVGEIKVGSISKTRDYLNKNGISGLRLFKKGTILFPKSGASTLLNHRVIMNLEGYVSSHLATIKADNNKILDKYLFYLLKEIDAKDLVPNPSYPSLNLTDIKEIEIPVPSLDVQLKLINELDSYQKIIDGFNLISENYKPIFDIDESWRLTNLLELSNNIISGHNFDSKDFKKKSDIKVLKITNVGINKFNKNTADFLPVDYLNKFKKFSIFKGDIVVALTRTIISSGVKVAEVPESFDKSLLNQRVAAIRIKNEITKKFIYLNLISERFKNYVIEKSNTLMQPNLSINDLKNFPIYLPDIETQKIIVEKFDKELNIIRQNQKLVDKYESTIDAIIKDVLSV
jgi:type I restriction enzyme M protein